MAENDQPRIVTSDSTKPARESDHRTTRTGPDPTLDQEHRDHARLAREFLTLARQEATASLDLIRAKGKHGDFDPMQTSAGRSALALEALTSAVELLAARLDGLTHRADLLAQSVGRRDYAAAPDWPTRPEPTYRDVPDVDLGRPPSEFRFGEVKPPYTGEVGRSMAIQFMDEVPAPVFPSPPTPEEDADLHAAWLATAAGRSLSHEEVSASYARLREQGISHEQALSDLGLEGDDDANR